MLIVDIKDPEMRMIFNLVTGGLAGLTGYYAYAHWSSMNMMVKYVFVVLTLILFIL
jgi:hypothetical protein